MRCLPFYASHLFLFDQLGYKGECLSNFWFPEVYEATHVPFPLLSVCLWQHCIGSFLLAPVEVLVIDMCLPELFSHLKVSMQHTNMSQCFEDVA